MMSGRISQRARWYHKDHMRSLTPEQAEHLRQAKAHLEEVKKSLESDSNRGTLESDSNRGMLEFFLENFDWQISRIISTGGGGEAEEEEEEAEAEGMEIEA